MVPVVVLPLVLAASSLLLSLLVVRVGPVLAEWREIFARSLVSAHVQLSGMENRILRFSRENAFSNILAFWKNFFPSSFASAPERGGNPGNIRIERPAPKLANALRKAHTLQNCSREGARVDAEELRARGEGECLQMLAAREGANSDRGN